ncbi:hypothetical protein BD626DRAFT_540802 [Schizophyllum amplum]|uniref:Uncharacterized protein n=1 Tax=Schizophyllum amplum TaxID=97359 RepID=A0A550BWQ0_9AGAR|nr:hypothetical protein BD626DRAFT_540802 [Auriculariopsis ampla]
MLGVCRDTLVVCRGSVRGGGTYVVREGDSASSSDSAPVAEESSLAVDESSLIADESSLAVDESSLAVDESSLAVDVLAAAAAISTLLVGPSEFREGIGVLGCVTGIGVRRMRSPALVNARPAVNTPLAGAGVVGDEGGGVAGEAGGEEDEDEATGGGVGEPTDGEGVGEPQMAKAKVTAEEASMVRRAAASLL